jgi:PKD repeat protein
VFSGNGISGNSFLPSLAGVGQHAITFTYVDGNGCTNLKTQNTKVYARPKANYVKDSECAGDIIHFTDMSSVVSDPLATSTINNWEWEFSDGITYFKKDTSRTFTYGSYTLKYTVTTDQGCDTTLISGFTIGPYPKPDFTWTKVCDQDITEFTNASSIQAGSILSYTYDFDDASATSSSTNPTHQFSGSGIYDVALTATSDKNCIATKTHKVFVVPVATTYPYFNDFESGAGGWVASSIFDTSATWELGLPVKSAFGTASSGINAWVTDLNGTHKKGEKSFVYSPCFNLSSLTKPMVSLDIIDSTITKSAGAALQYSLNDGQTWQVVGQKGDGVEWYNESGIYGQTGIQTVDQFGWTGVSNGWVTAKHDLNNLTGTNRVRFRVAFGADQSDNLTPGFGFDDFWIGERSKLVLIEHFTNSSNLNTAAENTYINNLITNNSEDVIGISYHLRSADGQVPDPMNVRNEEDANTRELFYSISQVPRSVVDGNFFNGNSLAVTQSIVNLRALDDPEFLIDINSAVVTSNSIAVTATLTAQENITEDVALQFAVVERNVTTVAGANGETSFQWVLTKLMPDGAGSILTGPWTAGDSRSQYQGWNFTSAEVYDANQIGIIVFVQNNTTKEVYQAAYRGPSGPAGSALAVDPKIDSELNSMELYPNPSANSSYVIFKEALKKDYQYNVIDGLGKVVAQGNVEKGNNGFMVNTAILHSGMYLVKIGNEQEGFVNRKLVVSH